MTAKPGVRTTVRRAGRPQPAQTAHDRRAQLEKALKDLKAVQEENAKLSATVKSVTLETVLRDKGIPPKIQRWLKRDGVERGTQRATDRLGRGPGGHVGRLVVHARHPPIIRRRRGAGPRRRHPAAPGRRRYSPDHR